MEEAFFVFFSVNGSLVHWGFSLVFPGSHGKALSDLLQRLKNLEGLDDKMSGLELALAYPPKN